MSAITRWSMLLYKSHESHHPMLLERREIEELVREGEALRAQLAEYRRWFDAHATVLATHQIGGFTFDGRLPGGEG